MLHNKRKVLPVQTRFDLLSNTFLFEIILKTYHIYERLHLFIYIPLYYFYFILICISRKMMKHVVVAAFAPLISSFRSFSSVCDILNKLAISSVLPI